MGLIKEPKDVDFIVKSEPWTEKELADFRKLMKKERSKREKRKGNFKKLKRKDMKER